MPFELGLAVAVSRIDGKLGDHAFALLESREHRLVRSLSDMNGYDPLVHRGTRGGAVRCMFELFADAPLMDLTRAQALAVDLERAAGQFKRKHGVRTLFTRVLVHELIEAANRLDSRGGSALG